MIRATRVAHHGRESDFQVPGRVRSAHLPSLTGLPAEPYLGPISREHAPAARDTPGGPQHHARPAPLTWPSAHRA
jgi:hypothetical protein